MPNKKSRWLGDTRGEPPTPVLPMTPNKIEIYTVFWKHPGDKQKGSIWLYHSRELMHKAGFRQDEDIPFRLWGHRPSLLKAKGKKWHAIYTEEEQHLFLASPMATKAVMADLVSRWATPPLKLRPDRGPAFSLHDLQDESHSHVYLVQLLTFHETASGQHYYKIGKAKSIPRRIKQFGPCRLVASIQLESEKESLRIEAELHALFSHLRRPETEIFCMNQEELRTVIDTCENIQSVSPSG
jgi:hypothetical protein